MRQTYEGVVKSKCASCGAIFYRQREHAYRLKRQGRVRMYCGYACLRKAQREQEQAEQAARDECRAQLAGDGWDENGEAVQG